MKAIILAAGVGKRLGPVAEGRPKCLVEVGGQSLLSRHLDNLAALGVRTVVLVVGYQQDLIREAVASSSFPGAVQFVVNEQYTRGSITSLWEARKEVDDDVIIMDADVLYHPDILRRLVESKHRNALLVDESVSQETEECMVAIQEERVTSLSKTLPAQYDFTGEGVGFLKVGKAESAVLFQSVEGPIESGHLDMEYEDALKGFFEQVSVGYERIGGLPWIEIDFPEDVQRAEHEILPMLSCQEKEVV
ncbi:phosphocholine cytidylyltransferase family protein [Nitrospira sp. M1]